MKIWWRILQTIGALNLILSAIGIYTQVVTAWDVSHHRHFDPAKPYFFATFWAMNGIDAVFLMLLVLVSIMLLKRHLWAAIAHVGLFLALIFYLFFVGLLWLLPSPISDSIAAASGVGDMGIATLLFFPIPWLYPLISVVCVIVAWIRIRRLTPHLHSTVQPV